MVALPALAGPFEDAVGKIANDEFSDTEEAIEAITNSGNQPMTWSGVLNSTNSVNGTWYSISPGGATLDRRKPIPFDTVLNEVATDDDDAEPGRIDIFFENP